MRLSTPVSSGGDNGTRRVFFALWPDERVRGQLAAVQEALGFTGRPVVPENFHVTLAFIGNTDSRYLECLVHAAAQVRFAPFEFTIDRTGYFRKPRVAYLAPGGLPEPMAALHQFLISRLQVCGYKPEARPLQPHVTLARKSDAPPQGEFSPLVWPVHSFCLVESRTESSGAAYSLLHTYQATEGRCS